MATLHQWSTFHKADWSLCPIKHPVFQYELREHAGVHPVLSKGPLFPLLDASNTRGYFYIGVAAPANIPDQVHLYDPLYTVLGIEEQRYPYNLPKVSGIRMERSPQPGCRGIDLRVEGRVVHLWTDMPKWITVLENAQKRAAEIAQRSAAQIAHKSADASERALWWHQSQMQPQSPLAQYHAPVSRYCAPSHELRANAQLQTSLSGAKEALESLQKLHPDFHWGMELDRPELVSHNRDRAFFVHHNGIYVPPSKCYPAERVSGTDFFYYLPKPVIVSSTPQ